jgi:uncharacterized protein (UPF0548 family)
MFTLRKPTEPETIEYLISRNDLPLTYGDAGLTLEPSRGFKVDRHRVLLGYGEDVFQKAKDAIGNWEMFPTEMAELLWPDRPISQGTVVGVLFRATWMWSLNPCRIVSTIDETRRFGFTYGTLSGHLECGEERFCIERRMDDDSVWYELLAVSRPRHLLTWLGYPFVRHQQARFRRLSGEAMQRAVTPHHVPPPLMNRTEGG